MAKLERERLERLAAELMEKQFKRVPKLREFHEGAWIDREHYKRHMIEAVLRIRMNNVADAYAVYKASFGDYRLASKLARYLAEELGHEAMFARDLSRFGVTLEQLNATQPFPSTLKAMGYLRLATDARGPAPTALWDWYLEWYSDRYIPTITEAARKAFGDEFTVGTQAHLNFDDSREHDELMFETTALAVELYGTPEDAYNDLAIYMDLGGEYFMELYDATVGSRRAE
ncbi:hypothetical protein ACMHYB_56580 [Sorangium sp. So ce1128]|uniref:Uncharacterized protein n=1 Tax=Sorangium cellulosum TaxID=56 RepID=A0A3S5GY89_SORCE|nr:hypothetical protein [Sorangium cellulosum]